MHCYLCESEAVSRCYNCGELICEQHGTENCVRCDASIAAGDPRPSHVSPFVLKQPGRQHGWWRPQQAEEYEPPACHVCQGLARRVCRNCQDYYCSEHAGPGDLCGACHRSSLLGLVCFVVAVAMMLLVVVLSIFDYP